MNDSELLQRYAETGCEASFTELVKGYIDLVYSAALRQVGGDAHLAHDVTQSVFIDLARKGRAGLSSATVLTGWLYTSTRFAAAKMVRGEQRRHAREEQVTTMQELLRSDGPEPAWEQIRPILDEAMHELGERDRNAVLLRYFEGRQLSEVGGKLGLSEEAARKRVGRALEKLRQLLARRGVKSSTAAALAGVFASQAVTAAPAGLAINIAGTAVASATAGAGTTLTFIKLMAMTKLKLGIVSAVLVAGVVTPLVIQQRAQARLRENYAMLRQENEQLTGQVTPLAEENLRLSNLLARATAPQPGLQMNASNEILKLRGEVARLQRDARELARLKAGGAGAGNDGEIDAAAQGLATRATKVRQRLEEMPEKKIPELQFLAQNDWINAVSRLKQLETDTDYREAMSALRSAAKGKFGGMMQEALKKYAAANDGMLPTELAQLQPFLGAQADAAMLQRYELVAHGKLSDNSRDQILINEIAPPVDDEYDTHFDFRINGTSSHSVSKTENAVESAAVAYAAANNGLLPRQVEQLAPYLNGSVDRNLVQEMLNKIPPHVTTLEQLNAGHR